MTLDASGAAKKIVEHARARPWGVAVAVLADGETSVALDPGADPLSEQTLFQIGSITKAMTGILLADSVLRGEVALATTVGDILEDEAANAASVTLLELATHRSGLPRLAPNHGAVQTDPSDPYAAYTPQHLIEALAMIDAPVPGTLEYSNFGYMLVGLLLERVTDQRFAHLIDARLFVPLDMGASSCGVPDSGDVVPGYHGPDKVPWWHVDLPAVGGVASTVTDMTRFVSAQIDPPDVVRDAIDLAQDEHAPPPSPMGLGWNRLGGGHWKNGGTGGFRSVAAFHRDTKTGVVILTNAGEADFDNLAITTLTELARARVEA